jgi:hypothetical protein
MIRFQAPGPSSSARSRWPRQRRRLEQSGHRPCRNGDFPGAEQARGGIALDAYASHQHSNWRASCSSTTSWPKQNRNRHRPQLDPGISPPPGRGRLAIAQDRLEEASEMLLGAVAANPSVASSSVLLAIAYYQSGQYDAAMQSLEDGDRLDPNDPEIALVRTVIALNESQAGEAIRSARDAYRRYLRQGKVTSPLAAARGTGSYLFSAFSNLSLNDWGAPMATSPSIPSIRRASSTGLGAGDGAGDRWTGSVRDQREHPAGLDHRSVVDLGADALHRPRPAAVFDPVLGAGGFLR